MRVGNAPADLGIVDINPTEMMFWMYCPIKVPFGQIVLPDNLTQFMPIIEQVLKHEYVDSSYMFITAKTLWVSGEYIGNRPGWHCDGFGTNDINYIWCDRAPTEFVVGGWYISSKCDQSLIDMEELAANCDPVTYPAKTLLRLDPTVVHRSPVGFEAGMRSFVKISVSKNPYDLEGNSVNHNLDLGVEYKPRRQDRNHPTASFNEL